MDQFDDFPKGMASVHGSLSGFSSKDFPPLNPKSSSSAVPSSPFPPMVPPLSAVHPPSAAPSAVPPSTTASTSSVASQTSQAVGKPDSPLATSN